MKILAALDAFKGSMTSEEANQIVAQTLKTHEVTCFPVADGGEGTVQAFCSALNGQFMTLPMTNVNGVKSTGTFGYMADKKTAVIEVAEGAGLLYADKKTFHPKNHTSFGVGEQILQALDCGAKTIILGLGGSATVDGGMGMMMALGAEFYDAFEKRLPKLPVDLKKVASIKTTGLDPRLSQINFIMASDVTNPLLGKKGATSVFGPQKGYLADEIVEKECAMAHFSRIVFETVGVSCDQLPGAGAAGGIGFSCYSFLNATYQSGLMLLANMSPLRSLLNNCDLVITGEGKFDDQSLAGKVPIGISRLAKESGVPCVVFAGEIKKGLTSLVEENIIVTLPIVNRPMTLAEAMAEGKTLLEEALKRFNHTLSL